MARDARKSQRNERRLRERLTTKITMDWQFGEMRSLRSMQLASRMVARWDEQWTKKIPAVKAGIQKIGLESSSQHLEGKGWYAVNLQQILTNCKVVGLNGLP